MNRYSQRLITLLSVSLLGISLFSLSISARAQDDQTITGDYRDHPELVKLVARLGEQPLVQGNFTQTRQLNSLPMPLKSDGIFVFWRGHGLYQEARKPFFNAFTITPAQLISWSETGEGREVKEQSALVQREINKTLLSFFNADIAVIQSRFDTRWTLIADNNWTLELTPKIAALAKHMQRIELHGSLGVDAITIYASADTTELRFSEQTFANAPTPSQCQKFFLDAAPCAAFKP